MAGSRFSRFSASAALLAFALTGCNRTPNDSQALLANQSAAAPLPDLPATLPMTDAPATPITTAPRAAALPEARPIRTVRVRDSGRGAEYAYADAAYRFNDALGDAPPDYGFDYQGVEPWAWQGYDDSVVFAEPVSGGYRTYYYRPGAEQPYFVRDPYYSYGYDDGQLAVVYAPDGAVVPWADYGPQLVYASRYLSRGRDLWRASRAQRIAISAESWTSQRTTWFETRQRWGDVRMRQPAWANYARQDAVAQNHWQAEQIRRQADARRFADWQADSYHAAPPPRAIPAHWQQAPWARDASRFAPAAAVAGGAVAVGAAIAQRQHAVAARNEQALLADTNRTREEQMQARAQQQHQQMIAQQQAGNAQLTQQRQQLAARVEQQRQARANEMNQQRLQARRQPQSIRADQNHVLATEMTQRQQRNMQADQQRVRMTEMAQHRQQQQTVRVEQQQARIADNARREQANAARAEQMQARAQQQQQQQQQMRAAETAQRAQSQMRAQQMRAAETRVQQVARAPEPPRAPAQAERPTRPAAPPQRGPEREHDHR